MPAKEATLLDEITEIAWRVGLLLLENKECLGLVEAKKDGSPVTQADLEADTLVRSELQRLRPGIPIVSEESAVPPFSERREWQMFWLVDALDGTKEFVAGRDEYTVNIALIQAGVPVLGVVHAPERKVLYSASREGGSWKRGVNGLGRIRIFSERPDQRSALTVVESRSHPSPELEDHLRGFKIRERIKMGSSLKFCLLAEGRAQFYPRFGPTMEWDVAAGDCVFRYSGKHEPRYSPLHYNQESMRNGPFVLGLD